MNTQFYIYVKGQAVEVSHEIYAIYHSMIARARYLKRRDKKHGTIHFSELDRDDLLGEEMIPSSKISKPVEHEVFEKFTVEQLYVAIGKLDEEERDLIRALYFEETSQSELSRETGVPQQTISYRVARVLNKLRKLMTD